VLATSENAAYGLSMGTLLKPTELDEKLRYPKGKCARLARLGKLPHVKLPDGQIRFCEDDIERMLKGETAKESAVA
jgi:predicted site-specific integrase-resolvase